VSEEGSGGWWSEVNILNLVSNGVWIEWWRVISALIWFLQKAWLFLFKVHFDSVSMNWRLHFSPEWADVGCSENSKGGLLDSDVVQKIKFTSGVTCSLNERDGFAWDEGGSRDREHWFLDCSFRSSTAPDNGTIYASQVAKCFRFEWSNLTSCRASTPGSAVTVPIINQCELGASRACHVGMHVNRVVMRNNTRNTSRTPIRRQVVWRENRLFSIITLEEILSLVLNDEVTSPHFQIVFRALSSHPPFEPSVSHFPNKIDMLLHVFISRKF
jgi:hypothetical protein